MDDKKKKYIIIGAVVLVVLYFVWKSSQSGEDTESSEEKASRQIASKFTNNMATIGTSVAVVKSQEDEEYQMLLDELQTLSGGKLPAGATSWSTNELKTKVKELKTLEQAYLAYAAAEEDESKQMEFSELYEKGYDTLGKIQQLTREVTVRNQQERLSKLLEAFRKTCNNYGSIWHPAGAAQQTWDTSTLKEIMALPDSDLKVLNNMVKEHSDEFYYPDNYSALNYRYYKRTSLSNAIPNGTLCSYRSGSSVAQEFKKNMSDRDF